MAMFRRLVTANAIAAVVVVLLTLLVPSFVDNLSLIGIFTTANVFAMFAASWDILSGFTGQVNFGHAAFIGTGGFTVGLLTKYDHFTPDVRMLLGTLAAAALGVVIGVPALRLRGPYLALATLASATALLRLNFIYKAQTGGEEGISGIPGLEESAVLGPIGRGLSRLVLGRSTFDEMRPFDQFYLVNYYAVLVVALLMIGGLMLLGYGRRGLVLRSIQQDEVAAEAAGVPVVRYKLAAFVLSGACGGLAGAIWVHTLSNVGINTLLVDLSLLIIVMAALGGAGTIVGPVAGAYAVIWLQDYVLDKLLTGSVPAEKLSEVKVMTFTALLVVVLIVQPRGLVAPLLLRRRAPQPLATPVETADG